MSQHGYMRHTATPPLVLEIGQKLWQYCQFLSTSEHSAKRCFIALFQLELFAAWIIALATRSAADDCISDYATLLTG